MKRERGEGGLFRMKNSRMWYGQWYKNGRQIRVSLRTDAKEEAKRELRRMMGDTERGLAPESEARKIRYEDLRAALLQNYVERGNKSLQTTADGEETIWGLKALDEHFKGCQVSKITTDSGREFAKKRLSQGAANGTVNGSLALLRRMLSIAVEDGKLQFAPKIRLLKPGAPRKGFLPLAQFDNLLSHIPVDLKPIVLFLYYCGVRIGEARQINWSQVDQSGGLITLEGEQTKNEEARTVPLPNVLIGMLEKLDKSGPVFDATNIRKEWHRACVAAGLGTMTKVEGKPDPVYTGLLIHDLRRSAIKNLMKAGVKEKVAMSISGHKTRSVFDRYHIVDTEDVVEAMQKVQDAEKVGESSVSLSAEPKKNQS